jgi:hypothetical protein
VGGVALDAKARVDRVVQSNEVDEHEHEGDETRYAAMMGMSAGIDRLMKRRPKPGHWNTVSVTIAKAMMPLQLQAVIVITGTSVFLTRGRNGSLRSGRANLM